MNARERTWGARFRLREWSDRSWILIPSAYVAAALVLGKLLPALEHHGSRPFGLALDADSAREILQAVAGGMIAFTGLVLSVAIVVVQFGASQYTPRLVLRFRRDPVVKHALGVFITPALFALVSLGDVHSDAAVGPNLTVAVAVALLVVAVVVFFLLVARLLDLLRPRRLYDQLRIGAEHAIDQVFPDPLSAEPDATAVSLPEITTTVRHEGRNGVLSALDLPRLMAAAQDADAVVEVPVRIGEYVWHGEPLIHVRGGRTAIPERELRRSALLDEERTLTQDPPFAIRTIVDIALRALSPAVNDPTTAVQALDTLESLLHRLAGRDLGNGHRHGTDGRLRVVSSAPDWSELLELALTEVRAYGADAHQVARRLRALLDGLLASAPTARRPAIEDQLALLDAAVERAYPDPAERALATVADHTGLGGRTDRIRG